MVTFWIGVKNGVSPEERASEGGLGGGRAACARETKEEEMRGEEAEEGLC